MGKPPLIQSLFSQRLDRAVFGIYFLSAVVPVLALAWVVQSRVLSAPDLDVRAAWGWIGGLMALGLLSLALYFALRRITHSALARMDADNLRLAKLLAVSQRLSLEPHFDTTAERVIRCAQELSGSSAAFALFASGPDKELTLREGAGPEEQRLFAAQSETLLELAAGALRDKAVAVIGDARASMADTLRAVAVAPMEHPEGVRGAVVVANPRAGAFDVETLDALQTLAGLATVALQNNRLREAQRNFFTHVTDLLVGALDSHVDSRRDHATNVAHIANSLAREMGLAEERLQDLHFAALLHDVGMLKIDRELHSTPKACRSHAAIGARMLGRIQLWEGIAPIVLHHHEWFDGSGYPEGTAGEAIPLESRIIAVADACDAMARATESSEGTLPRILHEFEHWRGSQFDPQVLAAFRALAERGAIPLS